ncbi:hypothetical protein F3Y22_tig00111095pilonHSYRG00668 [Hibiscus syriacus]|uniref:Protein kinase domain-containing protein n=1 Tax=Hibiscus syriacus TaxID=106335 RepID=A0A6A2Z2B0_HIBSY|nr:hypothetical protein F3Y22_tig00111095pilonHSYRG00668 [Hibiscus syriacus]
MEERKASRKRVIWTFMPDLTVKEVQVIKDDQTSKECLKQLNQEISLLSELSHPNIVQYYGRGSIHKLLGEYGSLKEPVIRSYTRQILSGLAYLHGRNTVHRNIKGANILVDPNGEIKLADFGMAKHMSCSSMLSFKGSPYWVAPEEHMIMNTNGYSLAIDIWSLGCTILEMATSKPPWSQYEGVAAKFKIANGKGYPEIPNNLSKDAQNFIELCLQRDPTTRPTALQLQQHPFIQDQPVVEPKKFNMVDEGSWTTLYGRRNTVSTNQQKKPFKGLMVSANISKSCLGSAPPSDMFADIHI